MIKDFEHSRELGLDFVPSKVMTSIDTNNDTISKDTISPEADLDRGSAGQLRNDLMLAGIRIEVLEKENLKLKLHFDHCTSEKIVDLVLERDEWKARWENADHIARSYARACGEGQTHLDELKRKLASALKFIGMANCGYVYVSAGAGSAYIHSENCMKCKTLKEIGVE